LPNFDLQCSSECTGKMVILSEMANLQLIHMPIILCMLMSVLSLTQALVKLFQKRKHELRVRQGADFAEVPRADQTRAMQVLFCCHFMSFQYHVMSNSGLLYCCLRPCCLLLTREDMLHEDVGTAHFSSS